LLSAYLLFAGTTWPFQVQGIQYRNLVGISCAWDVLAWNMIALMALTKKRWSRLFEISKLPSQIAKLLFK
jgi:hypothetical protein